MVMECHGFRLFIKWNLVALLSSVGIYNAFGINLISVVILVLIMIYCELVSTVNFVDVLII